MLLLLALVAAALWLDGPLALVVVGVAALAEIGEVLLWLAWNRRHRARVGVETLPGRTAVVVLACRPEGQVRLDGELWRARCAGGADPGERVRVQGVDGLTLIVREEESSPAPTERRDRARETPGR